ncbi:TonB-dependent receptor [Dysgonomonas sp.]
MKNIYITLSLFILTALSVNAQNKSITDTIHQIKEVEITARGIKPVKMLDLNVPITYLPITVSTVSSNTLELRGITNLQDAMKFLPGAQMNTSYGAFQTLTVRGFSSAPIMVDGVRDERTTINSFPFSDLSDIESIELLKGPASVLYGHSVVGGMINIVRKTPTAKPVVNTRISYGSWENKQALMDFGGKLAGPVNYRANIFYADQDGWHDNGNKRFSGYFALGTQIDKTSSLNLRGGFKRDFYGTEIGLPPNMKSEVYNADGSVYLAKEQQQPGLNRKARYNSESDFFKNDGWNISLRYDKEFNKNMKLRNYFSFNYDDINYFGTETLSYLESSDPIYKHYYMSGSKKQYICLDSVYLSSPLRFSHIANMLRDQLELSGIFTTGNIKHNYLGGYAFSQMFRTSFNGYNNAPKNDPLNSEYDVYGPGLYSHVAVNDPHSMGYMETKFSKAIVTRDYTHGIYFQDLIEVSEKLKVMLAGRYDFYKYMRAYKLNEKGKPDALPTYNGKREFDTDDRDYYSVTNTSAFTYRAGLVYMPVEELSVYGSMASFFFPDRTFFSETTVYLDADGNRFEPTPGKQIYEPLKGFQAEIGTRYTYKNLLQATASVFFIRRNNEKKSLISGYTDPQDGKEKTVSAMIGRTDSKGFDLEVTFTPLAGIEFMAGYSYTDATITYSDAVIQRLKDNGMLDPNTNLYDGMRLAMVPKNTLFFAGSYRATKGIFKNAGVHFTTSYTDNVYKSLSKDMFYPAYWITDLGLSYSFGSGITLTGNVNNLFNEKYVNQSLGRQLVPSMPRNYLVSVSYKL